MTNDTGFADFHTKDKAPNPIVDVGCPRSVGRIESAVALSHHLGIDFLLEPLDCEPFMHGNGENCSNDKVTIRIWNLPTTDINNNHIKLPL